jgi:membrane associated rhomboid family serine protease
MLIPIHDENPTSRTAWVTLAIIAANAVVFLLWQPTLASGPGTEVEQQIFFFCHAEIPYEVTHQENLADGGDEAVQAINRENIGVDGRGLQLVLQGRGDQVRGVPPDVEGCPDKNWALSVFVAMFMHGGWLHIAGNMLFLWVFGNNVEDKIGRPAFVLFYLACGVVAAAAQIATSPDSVVPSLGASGSIAGVLGAYLIMFPRRRVYSIVPIFLFATFIPLPAIVVLGFWFVLQLFNGFGSVAQNISGGVAYFAHIGGFVAGVVAALLFFPKERRVRSGPPLDL